MRPKFPQVSIAILGVVSAAYAVAPFATISFEKEIEGTDKTTPITVARLDDLVCMKIRDVSTPDGDHALRVVIYDGSGREVYQSVRTVTPSNGKWRHMVCYGFNLRRDSPGTWWYVAELDDQPLVSKDLLVSPTKKPGAG